MTNTLHRFGSAESFVDDYLVIALPAKSVKGQGDVLPRLKKFLEIALEYDPVNIGDSLNGGGLRPTRHEHVLDHFGERPTKPDLQKVIEGLTKATTVAAVFDKKENAENFVTRIRKEDLGVSVNISSSIDNALGCCKASGATRHSVGYSLGFEGIPLNDPNRYVLMLSTMCGHGMVSQTLARKMIDFVKENRRTPDECVASLSRFCSCGIFNTTRAKRIIEEARKQNF
jgi:hypothetical protein